MLFRIVLGSLAVFFAASPAHAAFPGGNGRIVWSSQGDLWTDAGRLTSTPEQEAQAAWSPDGSRIAFRVTTNGSTALRIAVMDADGTDRRVIAREGNHHETQPGWSPDGSRIIFRRTTIGQNDGQVWVMDADGSDPQRLYEGPGADERYPVFSPDGTRMAFTSTADGDVEILVASADGTGATPLTQNAIRDSAPSWSPDATRLAFERGSDENAPDNEIWTLSACGGDERRLTFDATLDEGPVFSPDGAQIVFTSARNGVNDIWRMAADGSSPTAVAAGGAARESPDWQAAPPAPAPAPRACPTSSTPGAPAPGAAIVPGQPGQPGVGSATTAPSTQRDAQDRDRDGLTLRDERRLRTSDLDRDTDDDGLGDGREVGVAPCATAVPRCLRPDGPRLGSPRRFDTDRDGISDGVERGVRRRVADPPGPVRGTARRRFRRDLDPRTRTSPLRRDSDRDGLADGREDRNRNGRRDAGERNPLRRGR